MFALDDVADLLGGAVAGEVDRDHGGATDLVGERP